MDKHINLGPKFLKVNTNINIKKKNYEKDGLCRQNLPSVMYSDYYLNYYSHLNGPRND